MSQPTITLPPETHVQPAEIAIPNGVEKADRSVSTPLEPIPIRWNPLTRIAFRFCFVYFILFAFPGPIMYLPGANYLGVGYQKGSDIVVRWTARSVLGIERDLGQFNGSGDRTYDYVLALCHLAVAVGLALVWSLVDWRRKGYPRLNEGLRIFLRYSLGLVMLGYGLAKLLPPTQFPSPSPDRLLQPYGDSSPMGLLWTFMGASQLYTNFAGLMEVVGGVLLLFRRTTLLGALVTAGVMLNVVMLNFCYDVPVKLFSGHLLILSLFLLLPDVPRLFRFFVLHRPAEPGAISVPIARRGWRITWMIAKGVFVVYLLGVIVYGQVQMRRMYVATPPGALAGTYTVESFELDGKSLPALLGDKQRWRRVSVANGKFLAIRTMDDQRAFYQLELDEEAQTLTLKKQGTEEKVPLTWKYEITDGLVWVTGKGPDGQVKASLKQVDREQFLLVNRGFHWVNEMPYNR